MTHSGSAARIGSVLAWIGWAAVVVVMMFAVVDWVGWATGIEALTRVLPTWPQMTPWSAALLAALGVAIVVQSGRPSRSRTRFGCGLAVLVGVLAVVFLAEYASGNSFGLDQLWFPDAVRSLQQTWPGRPSPRTATAVLLLSLAVGLTRQERMWTRVVWPWSLVAAMLLPSLAVVSYLFDVTSLAGVTPSTGMGISTALGLLLLVAATVIARPDRNPLAWLLARPDATPLLRLAVVLAGLPVLLGLSRLAFLTLGTGEGAALVLAVSVSTVMLGAATFYVSQREQKLLIEKERLSSQRAEAERERADAEARYRILADNSVDVVLHLRGSQIRWVSPSLEAAFGFPPERWIGSDFLSHIHPDDVDAIVAALQEIAAEKAVVAPRFRVKTAHGDFHWVDGHGKPYIDAEGNIDGATGSMRIVDEQVDAQRKLERLARFDTLTGLVNRGEAIARLQTALSSSRKPGPHLGLLFCDVDQFKAINDTWGHAAGDTVLTTIADRIRDCVREADTVGRTGGDEMLVLLPGVHSLEEVAGVAEKIRSHAAQPIRHGDTTIHATLSIGATLSAPGESADTVTARADAAMYRAKQAGRDTVIPISTAG